MARPLRWYLDRFVRSESALGKVSRGTAGTLTLHLLDRPLTLVVAVLLARALGPDGYGIYSYALAVISVAAVPALFGAPTLVVRQVAASFAKREWDLLHGVLRRATQGALVSGVVLLAAALVALWALADRLSPAAVQTALWALLLFPVLVLGRLRGAALRGLGRVVQGQLPTRLLEPLLLCLLVGGWLLAGEGLGAPGAMRIHVAAAAGAFVVGAVLLWRALPAEAKAAAPEYADRDWLRALLPLGLIGAMQVINGKADLLLLGVFHSAEEVGIYRVATAGAALVVFGQGAVSVALAPQASRLFVLGRLGELGRIARLAARGALLIGLPVAVVFVAAGGLVLRWVFGASFEAGAAALAILSVGQVANAAAGGVVVLLNMTGHERETAVGVGLAAACNVLLNLALIPRWGMEGAAVATAVTTVLLQGLLVVRVRRRLGIWSTALSRG